MQDAARDRNKGADDAIHKSEAFDSRDVFGTGNLCDGVGRPLLPSHEAVHDVIFVVARAADESRAGDDASLLEGRAR